MKKTVLSVVIVSFNTRQILSDCLASLFRFSPGENFEVIVVDNASADGSPAMVKKDFPQVRLLVNRRNLGFGRANNQGAALARGEFILLLNSDTLVRPESLALLLAFARRQPRLGALGPGLLNADGTPQASAGSFPDLWVSFKMLFGEHFFPFCRVRFAYSRSRAVDWVVGAALLIKREVFRQVGGFDEKIFMYMEEVELCYRLKKAGFENFFYPEPKIVHLGGQSSVSGKKDPILNIYRGLLYFYRRHYSPLALSVLKLMLKAKASLGWFLGCLTGRQYLKETYGEALGIN